MHKLFDKVEDVWLLKWPPASLARLNWQLTSLAWEVSYNNQF